MLLGLLLMACDRSEPAPTTPAAPTRVEPGSAVTCPAEPRPLAGSWLAPDGPGPFPTAVILVGARSWNRWGDQPDAPWGHYRDIAQALVSSGSAVLVFDKGGTGETGGATVDESARVKEAHAAVACALTQPGADPTRLALIGHSQGSTIATLAAVQGAPVQGLVLLSPVVDLAPLAALPDGLAVTLVRGSLDGADADDKRLQVLGARKLQARQAVIPSADHLLLDASIKVPSPSDPATAVHPAALRVITDAVTKLARSEP
jgi:dienelactone hydrolase